MLIGTMFLIFACEHFFPIQTLVLCPIWGGGTEGDDCKLHSTYWVKMCENHERSMFCKKKLLL